MKALRYSGYAILGILIYITMVTDRIILALFVGYEARSYHYDKGIPKPTELTPEDVKRDIKDEIQIAKKEWFDEYLYKAIKRIIITASLLTSYWIFTKLSWDSILITSISIAIVITSIIGYRYFTKTPKNQYPKDFIKGENTPNDTEA